MTAAGTKQAMTMGARPQRVIDLKRRGEWDTIVARDRVVLDAAGRPRRRIVLTGEKGTEVLLDFARPVVLRDGDGLVLEEGGIVLVAVAPEALVEISAHDPLDIVRLAWHLGNRHAEVEITGDKLRIRRDHVLEEMLRGLGAYLKPIEAAFDPEPGAAHGHDGHG